MIKTNHTIVELNQNERKQLDLICDLYTQAKHFGFKLISKDNYLLFNNNPIGKEVITTLSSDNKKLLATKFSLTGRHVNSINIELGMIITSYLEQRSTHLSDLQYSLMQITKSIAKYKKANLEIETKHSIIKDSQSSIQKQTYAYQQFIIKNKNLFNNSRNKNDLTKDNKLQFLFNYRGSNLPNITKVKQLKELLGNIDTKPLAAAQKYGKNLYQINLLQNKQQRFTNKISKIENDIAQGKLRICFGTKQLFKQQSLTQNINNSRFNPQSILFKDHIDWLTSWYDARSHQFVLTGAGEEISGNQNCQATINHKGLFNLRVRIPDNLINKNLVSDKLNKYLTIKNVDFGNNNSLLQSSLLSEVKEVIILTVAQKAEVKQLKNDLFELKKSKFDVVKAHNLAKKAIVNLDVDKFNKTISNIDKKIVKLQEDIKLKSDIFNINLAKNNESIRTRKKKVAIPITYRFVKNTDKSSSKYGKWSVHFTVDIKEPKMITDISLGSIGVDLNANHLAVSEVDHEGKLIQSFNIHLNPETYKNVNNKQLKLINSNNQTIEKLAITENQFKLSEKSNVNLSAVSSNKTKNILGNAIKIITDLSLRTGKPIIIEKLGFTQKKRQLNELNKYNLKSNNKISNKKFNYNHMISSFAYSKFKEILKAQATRNGCEVIEVNPAYSSLIGVVNYVKPLGLSVHMAASYVIARRGLNKHLNKTYQIDEQPKIIQIDNQEKIEIYTKSKVYLVDYIVNSNLSEDKSNKDKTLYNGWSVISNLYKTLQKDIYKENLQQEKLKALLKSPKALSNESDLSYLFSEDYLPLHDTQ